MARGKKKAPKITAAIDEIQQTEDPAIVSRAIQIRLAQIAQKLGTTTIELLEQYGDARTVIEKFDSGNLQLLVERESTKAE
jgi:hypothetical protein